MKSVVLLFYIFSYFLSAQASEDCETDECYELSQNMRAVMNESTDPCDDFYEYTCGNYLPKYSDEMSRILASDFQALADIMKSFKPNISNEVVALAVLQKCMNDERDLDTFMSDFWDETDDLTKLFIEVTKVNAASGGIFKNDIWPFVIHDERKFTIIMTMEKKDSYPGIKKLKDAKEDVKIMNLTEYFYQLLPETDRSYEALEDIIYLDKDFREYMKSLERKPKSEIKQELREAWKQSLTKFFVNSPGISDCLQKNAFNLFPATSSMFFLGKLIKQENIDSANDMFKDLQTEASDLIIENSWLDYATKSAMLKKLFAVEKSIGYPELLTNQTLTDAMYNRVLKHDIQKQSYLELIRNVLIMNSEETYLQVSKNAQLTFYGAAFEYNANYVTLSHRITIAPFFIKFPYVNENLPLWSMLASFSYAVGHEIGHMFDPDSFYKNELRQPIKVDEKTKEEYDSRAECLVEKYSQYTFPGFDNEHLDGERTIGENFADQFGIQLAYRLFKKLLPDNLEKLPEFGETSTLDKQFFHRMAYNWCANDWNLAEIREYNAKQDPHSPMRFRVNGIVSNSPEFATAYGCAKSKPMNPDKKCPLF